MKKLVTKREVARVRGIDVRWAVSIADSCAEVINDIQERLGTPRQNEPTVRLLFILLALEGLHCATFYQVDLPYLIAAIPAKHRVTHGLHREDGEPYTLRQLNHLWCRFAATLDHLEPGISDEEQEARLELSSRVQAALFRASSPSEYVHYGSYALDATVHWAWGRPPRHNGKVTRGGRDGDGTRNNLLASKLPDPEYVEYDTDLLRHPPRSERPPINPLSAGGRARRRDAAAREAGAVWLDNKDKSKIVYGYAAHIVVTVGEEGIDAPLLITALRTTPATANPAKTVLPLLKRMTEDRHNDRQVRLAVKHGKARFLGIVLADGGYSGAKVEHWALPIRDLGGDTVFRLHAGNQEGFHGYVADGQALKVDGRPYCTCMPTEMHHYRYPRFPTLGTERPRHRADIRKREPYEYKPHTKPAKDGSRRFRAPHNKRCDHCTNKPAGERCCQKTTVTLTATELGCWQDSPPGALPWKDSWDRRNRVEGAFGIAKNDSRENIKHGTCQFLGLTKVFLSWAFRLAAFNRRQTDLWRERTGSRKKRRARKKKNGQSGAPTTETIETVDPVEIVDTAVSSQKPDAPAEIVAPAGPHKLRFLKQPKPPA